MEPLISIIVPVYNIENYIERSLRSICNQTYQNLEIIVVDDGSTDQSGQIVDYIAAEDKRIVAIHKENGGVSTARNAGIERASGEYIGFVDGDDTLESDMFEVLIANALKHQADISHCGYQMVFPDRVDYYYNSGELRVQDNYQGIYDLVKAEKIEPGVWNKLYKREVLENCRFDANIRINEDLLFNYAAFKNAKKSVYEDVAKYHYMIRKNSAATSVMSKKKLDDSIEVLSKIMKEEEGEIYQVLEKRYVYLLEKISSMKTSDIILKEYQKMKRQELIRLLKKGQLKATYSSREWFQLNLAAKRPRMYWMIHEVYSALTGSRNKYRV